MSLNWCKAYEVVVIFLALILVAFSARAESMFETYSQKGRAELSVETAEMGKQMRQIFDDAQIDRQQMRIDFSEYQSNLKKALLYGARLAAYTDYEGDLAFARDKEIFQGLPETAEEALNEDGQERKQEFMHKKYERMQQNVADEVATYVDLLNLSLDTCEALTRHDISQFQVDDGSREQMREFLHGQVYKDFRSRRDQVAGRWPELVQRLDGQLQLWQAPVAGPDDPIINPQIVKALQ